MSYIGGNYHKPVEPRREPRRIRKPLEREAAGLPPAEGMACPSCRARYAFGESCPDCQVDLVGESLVGAETPTRSGEGYSRTRVVVVFAILLGGFSFITGVLEHLSAAG